jgi:hypothetical protein
MKRAKGSPEWRQFMQKSIAGGFEVVTRIGDPAYLLKKDMPISKETAFAVFFAKKRGKLSKTQKKGMEILSALGLRVFKYQPEIIEKT